MKKKFLSIALTAALLLTSVIGTAVNASAATLGKNAGDQLVVNGRSEPTRLSGAAAQFGAGYNALWENPTSVGSIAAGWGAFGTSTTGNALSVNEAAENTYGGSGTSIKSDYKAVDWWITPAGGKAANHAGFRLNVWYTIAAKYLDTAAFAYWIKTDKPLYVSMSFVARDSAATTVFSKEVYIPEGAHVVEFPLGCFYIDGTNPIGSNGLDLQQLRVYYRPAEYTEEVSTAYIDNVGYYNAQPLSGLQMRNKAVTAYSFNGTTSLGGTPRVECGSNGDNAAVTLIEETDGVNINAYGGNGKSILFHTDSACTGYDEVKFNFSKIPLTQNGNQWGKEAVVCIWMKASRSVTLYFTAQDSEQWHDGAASWWKTGNYTINAGENILRIPVSEFNKIATPGTREDKWDYLGSLKFNLTWDGNNKPLDLYIDQIAVEYPIIGDANDDEIINVKDLIRLKKLAAGEAPVFIKALDVNASGTFDSEDLVTFAKYLVGEESLATSPYVAPAAEDGVAVATALDWGYDS